MSPSSFRRLAPRPRSLDARRSSRSRFERAVDVVIPFVIRHSSFVISRASPNASSNFRFVSLVPSVVVVVVLASRATVASRSTSVDAFDAPTRRPTPVDDRRRSRARVGSGT